MDAFSEKQILFLLDCSVVLELKPGNYEYLLLFMTKWTAVPNSRVTCVYNIYKVA